MAELKDIDINNEANHSLPDSDNLYCMSLHRSHLRNKVLFKQGKSSSIWSKVFKMFIYSCQSLGNLKHNSFT